MKKNTSWSKNCILDFIYFGWGGGGGCYWAIQRSWFARVNALCNLSHKTSREVAAHFRADS